MSNKKFIIRKDLTKKEFRERDRSLITLYRIQAVKNFSDVQEGDLGGYVEFEENLSQEGICWIYHNAMSMGDAWVGENAILCDNAKVFDRAFVTGESLIEGNAKVYGDATIMGNTVVTDSAEVYGYAEIYGASSIKGDSEVCGSTKLYSCIVKDKIKLNTNHTFSNKIMKLSYSDAYTDYKE